MTAVVRFGFGDYPMLISDLLLSGPEPRRQRFAIPTVGDVKTVFAEGCGFTPTGLAQKVAFIGDDLVLGWAGSRLGARTIIKELIDTNKQQPLSKDSLVDYFKHVDPSLLKGVGFLGFFKDASGIVQLGLNCETYPSKTFGEVGFMGTGGNDLREFFEDLPEFPIPPKQKLSMQAISNSFALSLSGLLLSFEIANRQSLLHFYGGGYEIVTLVEGTFKKLDDVTYLFWFVQIIDGKVGLSLDRIFKYSYRDDVLIIRTEDLTPSENMKGLMLTDSSVSVVPPVYRDISKEESASFTVPHINSEFTCNYFIAPHPGQGAHVLTRIHHSLNEEDKPIRFIHSGEGALLAVNKDLLKESTDLLKSRVLNQD